MIPSEGGGVRTRAILLHVSDCAPIYLVSQLDYFAVYDAIVLAAATRVDLAVHVLVLAAAI